MANVSPRLIVIAVAAGLVFETSDVHAASRAVEAPPAAQLETRHASQLCPAAARCTRFDLPPADPQRGSTVAAVFDPPRLVRSMVVEDCYVELGIPAAHEQRRAHRPRGPPVNQAM